MVSCYMCEKPAVSREHAPPLCLFPETKDVKGYNFRKNLITVPSCDEHNSRKSCDDEFLMMTVVGAVGNNEVAFHHNLTKINRALRRKSQDFLGKVILKNMRSLTVKTVEGYEFPILAGKPDLARLRSCFEHIAYGLFYHKFGYSFKGKIRVDLAFLNYTNETYNTLCQFMLKRFDLEPLRLEKEGENPAVFEYQFCAPDEYDLTIVKMTFYRGIQVFATFQPEWTTKEPYLLEMQLLNSGHPITFTLDDEEFKFNQS